MKTDIYLCVVKKLVAVILTFQLLMLSLGGIKATVSFALNKAYIIKELCIQKDEAVNSCQGHCHLTESIKQQAEDDANLELAFEGQLAPYIIAFDKNALVEVEGVEIASSYAPCIALKTKKFVRQCAHPPCA